MTVVDERRERAVDPGSGRSSSGTSGRPREQAEPAISSGKAAELLGTSRLAFIQHASGLGIPYLEMTEDEWAAEKAASESL
jgi:hypothetical protein